jgi:hypothetical protein
MIINFKKSIGFAALYAVFIIVFTIVKLIFISIFSFLSLKGILPAISVFIALVFSLLYSLYFKVKLSKQFKHLSSIYVTAIGFIVEFLNELYRLIAIGPILREHNQNYYYALHFMKLWHKFSNILSESGMLVSPSVIAAILTIIVYVISAIVLYIINYFLISWGNKLALWILKKKEVTEI